MLLLIHASNSSMSSNRLTIDLRSIQNCPCFARYKIAHPVDMAHSVTPTLCPLVNYLLIQISGNEFGLMYTHRLGTNFVAIIEVVSNNEQCIPLKYLSDNDLHSPQFSPQPFVKHSSRTSLWSDRSLRDSKIATIVVSVCFWKNRRKNFLGGDTDYWQSKF